MPVTLSNPSAPITPRTPSHSLRDPKRVETLYAPLCEHLADGVLVLDPDGVIIYANRDKLKDPDRIQVDQQLVIPPDDNA